MNLKVFIVMLITMLGAFASCENNDDDPVNTSSYNSTKWNGQIVGRQKGVISYSYNIDVLFFSDGKAQFSYNRKSSSFNYVMTKNTFTLTGSQYDKMNGDWQIDKSSDGELNIHKNSSDEQLSLYLKKTK
jgi:hypothetical protein